MRGVFVCVLVCMYVRGVFVCVRVCTCVCVSVSEGEITTYRTHCEAIWHQKLTLLTIEMFVGMPDQGFGFSCVCHCPSW